MAGDVSINVSQDVINGIVKAKMEAAIFSELSKDSGRYIEQVISSALLKKVDSQGNPERYENSGSPTFISWLTSHTVRDLAKKSFQELLESKKDVIKAMMLKEVNKRLPEIASTLLDTLVETSKHDYRLNFEMKFEKKNY